MKHSSISNNVSREAVEALEAFAQLLRKWNRRVNLISTGDEAVLWRRHIEDSLQLSRLISPEVDRAVDLGSGGGFPGLILAIATSVPFDLIESDQRKAAFLREAARITAAPVRVLATRIEAADLPPAPLVTARALAPLGKLMDMAARFVAPGGYCLFLKGASFEAELTHAAAKWHMRVEPTPSRTGAGACILRISEISRVSQTA